MKRRASTQQQKPKKTPRPTKRRRRADEEEDEAEKERTESPSPSPSSSSPQPQPQTSVGEDQPAVTPPRSQPRHDGDLPPPPPPPPCTAGGITARFMLQCEIERLSVIASMARNRDYAAFATSVQEQYKQILEYRNDMNHMDILRIFEERRTEEYNIASYEIFPTWKCLTVQTLAPLPCDHDDLTAFHRGCGADIKNIVAAEIARLALIVDSREYPTSYISFAAAMLMGYSRFQSLEDDATVSDIQDFLLVFLGSRGDERILNSTVILPDHGRTIKKLCQIAMRQQNAATAEIFAFILRLQ